MTAVGVTLAAYLVQRYSQQQELSQPQRYKKNANVVVDGGTIHYRKPGISRRASIQGGRSEWKAHACVNEIMDQAEQVTEHCEPDETGPHEVVVYDQEERCSYLAGRTARMPLRMPITKLTGRQFDQRLAAGDRRSGAFLYRTNCPQCNACEPIRVEVEQFKPNRSQGRAWQKGERELTTILGPPIVDQQRIDMFNAHRWQRGLVGEDREIDEHGYAAFLVETCCDTFEIGYYLDSQLIAVAICDDGNASVSAVYCFFDPSFSHYNLGTYSVLKQIELCQQWGKCYLYLGLYIAESPNMSYKANFRPHQKLIGGSWQNFDR